MVFNTETNGGYSQNTPGSLCLLWTPFGIQWTIVPKLKIFRALCKFIEAKLAG